MEYRIDFSDTRDPIMAQAGDTVLEALLREGIPFPHSCQVGNCGTCKCELLDGEISELSCSEHALSEDERARNYVLACRAQVWGDVKLRALDPEAISLGPIRTLRGRVISLTDLTHDIREVRVSLEPDEGPLAFAAGQYAQVEFVPGIARHYSMANMADEPEPVFHVRRVPGGRASAYVGEKLHPGHGVRVTGPYGSCYLREHHSGPVLLVAGGSGLAPIESILRTFISRAYDAPILLYFGARAEKDVYHEALLRAAASSNDKLQLTIALSEQPGPGRRIGLLHEVIAADGIDFSGYIAYLAGPPAMVDAVSGVLLRQGLEQRDLHADAFYNQP
jgi:CDP-4-dehydro-6-deoxyglucose reductase/ferredoxin-NAD(P)+ reductase (naphthalene dioxygenase ferredoxin-specific)